MFGLRSLRSTVWLLVAVVASAGSATGQVGVYNSNGFEPTHGYVLGDINGQQGFVATPPSIVPFLPDPTFAGVIVDTPVFAGSHALKIQGNLLVDSPPPGPFGLDGFNGGNFWYQAYTSGSTGTGFRPVPSGNPIVRASAQVLTTGAMGLPTDIPFAGLHFEGFTSGGTQQSLTPVYVNSLGAIQVFTNGPTSQNTFSVATDAGLVSRDAWHEITVEFDFRTPNQSFKVYLDGQLVTFTKNGNGTAITPRTSVPFRNTNGSTVQLAEIGALAFYGRSFDQTPIMPLNDFYLDDFVVTASPAPVPEPGSLVAVGFVVIAVGGMVRRFRARK